MKKLIIVFILTFLFNFSKAQKSFQLGMHFSPTVGWIKPDVDGVKNESNRIGFNYGVLADFNFAENYAISTGVNIISTGGTISYPFVSSDPNNPAIVNGGNLESETQLKYIEIPITFKLKTNQIGYITYYGQFGFGAAVNYDAEADLNFSSTSGADFSRSEVDLKDEVSLFRASMIIGAGAEYNISGNTSILIGLQFNNGLTNVYDFDVPESDANGNPQNNGNTNAVKAINNFFALNLGVLF